MKELNEMSLDELRALNRTVVALIREQARRRNILAGAQFKVNDEVEFNPGRPFPTTVVKGTIIKISRVTATVLPKGQLPWRVSLSMLRPATET